MITLIQQIVTALLSNITPCVLGATGIGKTAIVESIARSNTPEACWARKALWGSTEPVEVYNLRGSLHEPFDILGFPKIVQQNGQDVSTWIPLDIFPTADKNPEAKGILFLDEILRASPALLQAFFQLVEVSTDGHRSHRVGATRLPRGYYVVAANNYLSSKYKQSRFCDAAWNDRFSYLHLEVNDDYIKDWLKYCETVDSPHKDVIIKTVLNTPSSIYTDSMEFEDTLETLGIETTPRGMLKCSSVLDTCKQLTLPLTVAESVMSGIVGKVMSRAILETLLNAPSKTYFDILAGKSFNFEKSSPQEVTSMIQEITYNLPYIEQDRNKVVKVIKFVIRALDYYKDKSDFDVIKSSIAFGCILLRLEDLGMEVLTNRKLRKVVKYLADIETEFKAVNAAIDLGLADQLESILGSTDEALDN